MSYDHSFFPESFIDAVSFQWGETASIWLAQLPQQIQHLTQQLGLSELHLEPCSRLHWLGHAQMKGQAITLKLGIPDSDWLQECYALHRFQNLPHAVRLIAGEPAAGWYVMEQVKPGTSLSQLSDDHQALQIWLQSLDFLPAQASDDLRFVSLEGWTVELFQPVPDYLNAHIDQARNLCTELLKTELRSYLLHGDLHHDNLIYSQHQGWKLIDPKGVLASPEFELGAMLRNPYPVWNQSADLAQQLAQRLGMIKQCGEFKFERVKAWAYVQAVLAACWSLPNQSDVQLWLNVAEKIQL